MGIRTSYAPGTPAWADLQTSDVEQAKAFYSALFGWRYEDAPAGDAGTYTMAYLGDHAVGALMQQTAVPTHWNTYITVDSADSAAERIRSAGGTVVEDPFDVMAAGRMAPCADPQGAFFCIWEPHDHPGAGIVNTPGSMTWNELGTPDLDGARAFYADVFGWTYEEPDPAYLVVRNGEATMGGLRRQDPAAEAGVPPNWLVYFGAERLDAAVEQVGRDGGQVLVPRMEMPQGAFAVVADPAGAVFALWEGGYDA